MEISIQDKVYQRPIYVSAIVRPRRGITLSVDYAEIDQLQWHTLAHGEYDVPGDALTGLSSG